MFTLIDLPYPIDALEPVISARTLSFHHGKHLQGFVDNLNKLIAGTPYEGLSLEEIVVAASRPDPEPVEGPARKPIFNNAGQILNHNLYFTQFRPAVAETVERSVPELVEGPTHALIPGLTFPHSGLDPESPPCHFARAKRVVTSARRSAKQPHSNACSVRCAHGRGAPSADIGLWRT